MFDTLHRVLICCRVIILFLLDFVGGKRGFGDIDDEEDDMFGSKKVWLPLIFWMIVLDWFKSYNSNCVIKTTDYAMKPESEVTFVSIYFKPCFINL